MSLRRFDHLQNILKRMLSIGICGHRKIALRQIVQNIVHRRLERRSLSAVLLMAE